jgi:hypothetical protein
MNRKNAELPKDRTEGQRRKALTDEEVKALELAGGAEGGMQAGSAGGPAAGGDDDGRRPER